MMRVLLSDRSLLLCTMILIAAGCLSPDNAIVFTGLAAIIVLCYSIKNLVWLRQQSRRGRAIESLLLELGRSISDQTKDEILQGMGLGQDRRTASPVVEELMLEVKAIACTNPSIINNPEAIARLKQLGCRLMLEGETAETLRFAHLLMVQMQTVGILTAAEYNRIEQAAQRPIHSIESMQ